EYQYLADALEEAGGYVEGTGEDSLDSLETALKEAKLALDTAKARYANEYEFIQRLAGLKHGGDLTTYSDAIASAFGEKTAVSAEYYFGEGASITSLYVEQRNLGIEGAKDVYTGWNCYKNLPSTDLAAIASGYKSVNEAQIAYDKAQAAYDKALEQAQPQNAELNRRVKEAKKYMDDLKEEYDKLVEKKTTYDAAKDEVVSAENALSALLKTSQLDNLELSRMAKQIQTLKDKIAALSAGEQDENGVVTGGQVVSEVNGVVKEINVSAGSNTDPNTAAITVEVPDRGYTVSMSVTNEQAQKVVIGDSAEISTGYWGGSDMQARLVGVRADTQNPQSGGKLLVFDVTGSDIESGTQASISIGQRSQNYETIVPNSALRSDSNGSFVLVVVAKSSPLGNRFVATRVDVTELAKDDVNTAVSGGISAYDMVLTTSTKPVEDGMLVRLPD
ncbi:MAG TPA: hypothetical protein IAD42_08985, partial [Candidatus Scatomorpha pullistercoris]|nr:hypothetical protein [Candidatus Scatomorpha pullistercoris]